MHGNSRNFLRRTFSSDFYEENVEITTCFLPVKLESSSAKLKRLRVRRNLFHAGLLSRYTMLLLCLGCFLFNHLGSVTAAKKKMPDLSKIPTPPSFVHEPNPLVMYFVVEQTSSAVSNVSNNGGDQQQQPQHSSSGLNMKEKRFSCEATGYPQVTYRWLKDGKALNFEDPNVSSRITRIPGTGSFLISKLMLSDAGQYQCIAENDNGTAVDRVVNLQQALMELFATSQQPEIIQINLGDPFKRDCLAPRSVPTARTYWVLMSPPTADRRVFRTINATNIVVNDKGTIFFQYVSQADVIPNLYYTCTADNAALKDYKFGSQFMFNVSTANRKTLEPSIAPNEQYTSPEEITILKGESLELFCVISGYPDFTPIWEKEGGQLNVSRISWSTHFKKSLRMYNVDYDDAGVYSCKFEKSPHVHKRFTVTVEDKPTWLNNEPPRNKNSSEGSAVTFKCLTEGKPVPKFTFYKNGQILNVSDDHHVIYGDTLIINNIAKGEQGAGDNAVYQCKAENIHGFIWANFYLNILAFRPVILDDPGVVETVVGKNANLTCKVFGSPLPKEQWDNKRLAIGSRGVHYDVQPVSHDGITQLVLKSVKKEDAGEYFCRFSNTYGSDSASGKLVVREATFFLHQPISKQIAAGTRLELECEAKHDSELTIEYVWLFHNRPITEITDRLYVDPDTHKLVMTSPSGRDTGAYTCMAKTLLDSIQRTVNITVKDVPLAPFNVQVKCFKNTAEVSFYYQERFNTIAPATSWHVQLNVDPNEPDAWDTYIVPTNQLKLGLGTSVVHLYPYGNFAFRVLAKNEVGFSQPAYAETFTNDNGTKRCATAPQKPARNPLNVKVKGNTPDNLVISWDSMPRRDWYGPNFEYIVQYKEKNNATDVFENITVTDLSTNSVVIDGVPTYAEYDVLVWAKNKEGLPKIMPAVSHGFSGEALPLVAPTGFNVRDIQGPSTATFVWKPVDSKSVRGEFKGYKVEHWYFTKKRSNPVRREAYFDNSATEGTIYDLKPNRNNYAVIKVYNNAGDGPESEEIEFKMLEGVPSAVQNLYAFAISHKELGVMWNEPREMNGNLTGYEVRVCQSGETDCFRILQIDPDAPTELRVRELQPDTKYRVEVLGRTATGPGELSAYETKTTAEFLKPVHPLEPSIENVKIGPDHMNVTWKPGEYRDDDDESEKRPPGDGFYFKYRPKDTDEWSIVNETTGDGLTLQLKDLTPGTTYEIRSVSVHNGLEAESPPHYYTTAGGSARSTTAGWLIALIVAIIFFIILLIIICLVVRSRGAKYPVSEKEKEQGREPMLKNEKGFGEYAKAPETEEEKTSLTNESKLESETDSMAEYGDGETGRFTEDGSFIGQYGPNKNIPGGDKGKTNLSTVL